jgi:hypothetical protein
LTALFFVALVGCDSGGENDAPSERAYTIRYEVTSTFDTCMITYTTASDGTAQVEHEFGGDRWRLELERTVTTSSPLEVQLAPQCSDDEAARTTAAELFIDGERFQRDEATGETVSLDLSARLTVDGPETL